jgi:hypothetical protein
MEIIFLCEECDRIVFHFNKAHNQDTSIPQWVVKHRGQTYYVNHLEAEVGFRTKETPDNEHTKGSLQFKGRLKITKENGISEARIY